jgi:hypothetical protein
LLRGQAFQATLIAAQNHFLASRPLELDPGDIIKLIKLGDTSSFVRYFQENEDGILKLERLNLMMGYED